MRRNVAFALLAACGCAEGGGAITGDAGMADGGTVDAGGRRFALNDVSILVRLPAPPEPRSAFLWLVPRSGELGPYFPSHRIDELPQLNGDLPDALGYPAAMVVGVRYDPSATELRLVAQPVPYEGTDPPRLLDDSAAHLFYRLDAAEAATIEAELEALARLSPADTGGPLGVHPALLAEGSTGAFGAALQTFVVAHCRADNFFRITVNSFAMDNWGFHRFEWEDDHPVRVPLENMVSPDTSQTWLRQAQRDDLEDPTGTIVPDGLESISYLLDRTVYAAPDPAALAEAVANLTRIENPRVRTVEMVDCVSCHLSSQLVLHAERHGVSFAGAPDAYEPPPGLDTRVLLAPELQGNLGATIMFGYHQRSTDGAVYPSIGRRVVFETAEVVAALNARR